MSKKSVVLGLDTSSQHEAKVTLVVDGHRSEKTEAHGATKAQIILPMIENILKEHDLLSSDLTNIEVHTGPGSFTGIRVGITVANTLGTLLAIPVNGKRALEKPTY